MLTGSSVIVMAHTASTPVSRCSYEQREDRHFCLACYEEEVNPNPPILTAQLGLGLMPIGVAIPRASSMAAVPMSSMDDCSSLYTSSLDQASYDGANAPLFTSLPSLSAMAAAREEEATAAAVASTVATVHAIAVHADFLASDFPVTHFEAPPFAACAGYGFVPDVGPSRPFGNTFL